MEQRKLASLLALTVVLLPLAMAGCGEVTGQQPETCEAFDDQPLSPTAVTVRLVNARSTPVYLGGGSGCGPTPLFALRGPDGAALTWARGDCTFECSELMDISADCPAICQIPPVVLIAPGGTYEIPWSGTVLRSVDMPGTCTYESTSGTVSCLMEEEAPQGDLQLLAVAGSEAMLSDCGAADCSCTPDVSGSCVIDSGGTVSGEAVEASATLASPGETSVDIVFE